MARSNNLPAKKYKAGERTERTLRFTWNAGDATSTIYIDIAKALSIINKRFYRQGLYYYVSGGYFVNGTEAHVQLLTVPDTWMTKLAWIRGFKIWSKMNRIATSGDTASIYPKYHDFKVRMHSGTASATITDPCHGNLNSTTEYAADEWVLSKFVSDDPETSDPQEHDVFTAHMLDGHVAGAGGADSWASIGLIHSLQDTWRYPSSTEPTLLGDQDTDPLANLFDAGDTHDDIRDHLDADNDAAPYNYDMMIGSSTVNEGTPVALCRTSSGSGAKMSFGGFCVPLGLLQVEATDWGVGTSMGQVELVLELTPGPYKGVYAERIL